MATRFDENDEHIDVLRHHNRVQRRVNQALRRTLQEHRNRADENFIALCTTKTEAQEALEKLWTLGEINCGPEDYDTIVEHCLEALRQVNPIDQSDIS
jgi:hypothetical protein